MSYQYPEQDPTQIPTFGTTGFWADAGEEYVDYSPAALAYHQQATTSASSSSASQKESRTSKSRHHKRKESKTSSSYQSGSDTEKESRGKMSSRSSRHQPSGSSRREKEPKPSKKANDDWSEVTDPEERRRIQNKIAQRKFSKSAGFFSCSFLSFKLYNREFKKKRTEDDPLYSKEERESNSNQPNQQEKKPANAKNATNATPQTKPTPSSPTKSPARTTSPRTRTIYPVCPGGVSAWALSCPRAMPRPATRGVVGSRIPL